MLLRVWWSWHRGCLEVGKAGRQQQSPRSPAASAPGIAWASARCWIRKDSISILTWGDPREHFQCSCGILVSHNTPFWEWLAYEYKRAEFNPANTTGHTTWHYAQSNPTLNMKSNDLQEEQDGIRKEDKAYNKCKRRHTQIKGMALPLPAYLLSSNSYKKQM